MALAAVSTPVAPRDAVTVTDSVNGRGSRTMRNALSPVKASDESPKPSARTRKVPSVPIVSSRVNRPSALVSTVARLPALDLERDARAATGAPEVSITMPAIGPPPDQHPAGTQEAARQNRGEATKRSGKTFEP